MSGPQDEARAARIHKYKEERRKQLTARTATLFSHNVTERRPRKVNDRQLSEDTNHLKASSDLSLDTASTSVPIRTTRTSRLRAAAAQDAPKKANRSSSVNSLIEDPKNRTSRSARVIERDKRIVRRQSREGKENVKASPVQKDIGAIKTKPKHSIVNLDKDKSKILVISPKGKVENASVEKIQNGGFKCLKEEKDKVGKLEESLKVNGEEILEELLNDSAGKDQFEDLFNDLVEDKVQDGVTLNLKDGVPDDLAVNLSLENGLNSISPKVQVPLVESEDVVKENGINANSQGTEVTVAPAFQDLVKENWFNSRRQRIQDPTAETPQVSVENAVEESVSVVPVNEQVNLLSVTCVKVERFSELLGNLCSPCDADLLFEDVLAENGLDSKEDERLAAPACALPCRRAQPSPRVASTPKRAPPASTAAATAAAVDAGTINKAKPRSPTDAPRPKTETAQSSRVSPKSAFNLSFRKSPNKSPPTPSKPIERRRSSETGTKPSCIPLSKRSAEKSRNSTSPVKQDLPKGDVKTKQGRPNKTPEKAKSDTDTRNDRRHRAQNGSEQVSEKYHNSKKRLTSLENISPKLVTDAKNTSHKLNGSSRTVSKPASEILVDSFKVDNMTTLHETRPHAGGSRLSQDIDSLAALTKQTRDRVNKLKNNLASNKFNLDTSETHFDSLLATAAESDSYSHSYNYGLKNERPFHRGVDERLKDIDTAAQRLIDFEKQNAMFSDLSNDTSSQNDTSASFCIHTPVSILKRKSIHEDPTISNNLHQTIASPPVTFSPNVVEPRNSRLDNRRQGILKKRRSLDESQVARQRSCSPEVSFADEGSSDTNKPILKNRRSSLEDVVRNQSPDGQIQGILKRKMSREEELHTNEDNNMSNGSPEPHGILKRKSNSSSSSSTASSHVSIAQAVLLAAAGGAEIIDDDKELVRPILKKKSFSEERPCLEILLPDTPKPILKKKSLEHDEYDFELPKKPILKLYKRPSGDEGHGSSFELSEDDRSSGRPSLLRSRTSDHSGSECEATVKPILKQRGSSLTRERSQSPRPRLSFCADSDAISVTSFSADADEAGPSRLQAALDPEESASANYPSAVLRRRNLRPKNSPRSKSLAGDFNDELLSILNDRRQKVEEDCDTQLLQTNRDNEEEIPKTFPSIAARIKSMEEALTKEPVSPRDQPSTSKPRIRDRGDRYKTQPITVEEMRSITSSLEPGQAGFQAFGPIGCSFPSRPAESGAPAHRDPFGADAEVPNFAILDSPPFGASYFLANHSDGLEDAVAKEDSYGEATFLDFENSGVTLERRQSTLEEIEQEVNKVRVALDEDSRALEEDERHQAEADNWSLNVSCDSGVYNRASSRDSGPHSGEELGLLECQEIKENHATNSSNDQSWSPSSVERGLLAMERQRRSTEADGSDEEGEGFSESAGFALGLVKSNSVVARAGVWQQLQQQAKGTPKPLIRHRSKAKDCSALADRFKTQAVEAQPGEGGPLALAGSKSTANMLDKDEDAKLDEDDPAKLSLMEKMKMFNSRLTHKPPVAGLPKAREERTRGSRLRTMPVLASQVQEAMENNERLTKSFMHEEVPRNTNFQMKMELFRSASAKNTSLEYIMRQNKKFRSLDMYDDDETPTDRAERMITPEVRGILKAGTTVLPPKPKTLAKGESSEGLKDEGIDSSSDDESASASSVSSSEKSCSSSDSSEDLPVPKAPVPRRFQARKANKLKGSRTDSDLTRVLKTDNYQPIKTSPIKIQDSYLPIKASPVKTQAPYQPIKTTPIKKAPEPYQPIKTSPVKTKDGYQPIKSSPVKVQDGFQPIKTSPVKIQDGFQPMKTSPMKIQLPCAAELKERLNQAKNSDVKIPLLGKLKRSPEQSKKTEDELRFKRLVTRDEPIQLGKLRRPPEKLAAPKPEHPPQVLQISTLNQEAKNKFFGLEPKREKTMEELAASVRRFIPTMTKSASTMEVQGSGSDGESSGGREVRHINTRSRHRAGGGGGGGIQRSATNADMPNRGGTIAERLAALQAAGANDWRARVCRLSPEADEKDKDTETKAIERAKNRINESLNTAVDEKKKIQIEDNEVGANILADRRNKLETAAQGWRKRVPQTDANLFTVAGRLERDKVVSTITPPLTPPPVTTAPAPASPGIPTPNKFRSRKPPTSPTNGFASGPLRSASCAVVSAAAVNERPRTEGTRPDRDAFKRSHSVSESISRLDENDEPSPGAEKSGSTVRVPRADDETFQAFFTPVLEKQGLTSAADLDVDLDAIDSGSRQLLASEWTRRAKRERKQAGSRNPLKALAARTDIREEYSPPPSTNIREQFIKEKATANCGLAAEALAALATKEDFSNAAQALRSAAAAAPISHGTKPLMLLHVKGRRRVQTRLVEPVHTSVNRGDCSVLVTPDQVFLYIGQYSNVIERNRSTDIALHIHTTKDLGCVNSSSVITIDEQSKNHSAKHWHQFWSLLGVTENTDKYKPAETGHPDEDEIYESCIIQTNMCYEVMDEELVPIKEYWGQLPKIAMLHQSKVIVFDFGTEMYIWYGKNVPLESRRRAAQLAQELFDEGYNYEDCHINPVNAAVFQGARDDNPTADTAKTSKKRPEWAILSKVVQHMETILFKEKFLDWPDYTRVIKVKPQENKTNSVEITPCDAEEMWANDYQDPDLILEGSHVGRGTHYYDKETMRHFDIRTKSVEKWVVQESDYQKVENESEKGDFYSGDSYIIRWEYQLNATGRELNGKPSKHNLTGRDRCAYFCWQGKDASPNEKGTAALLTVELDKEKGPQIRVAQGNEPPAFLNLFQGNLIIHQGKKDVDKSRYKLFITRGNLSNEAYLLQVPCSVRQLRSRGSLLLVDTEKGCLYIWHGARSLKHTKNIAIELANKLIARESVYLFGQNVSKVKINEVKEGEEPKEVLEALGSNKQYYNSVLNGGKDLGADVTPRLFHFTDLGGQFEANEVLSPLRHEHLVTPFPFEQKELYAASQPALFLLDDGQALWLWQGWWPRGEDGELEPAERNTGVGAFAARWQAMRAAALRTAESYLRVSRRVDTRVVAAGLEPQRFTDLFDHWREHDDAADANIAHGYKAGEVLSGACELSRLTSCDVIVPIAALQRRPLPPHVDPQHLERHLSDADFLEAFGMTKEDFSVLPAWKQTNMKKEIGLF